MFLWPYFQLGPLSEILKIVNLRYAASRIWTCAEPEFGLSWMKLCSRVNHYTRETWFIRFAKFCRKAWLGKAGFLGCKTIIRDDYSLSYFLPLRFRKHSLNSLKFSEKVLPIVLHKACENRHHKRIYAQMALLQRAFGELKNWRAFLKNLQKSSIFGDLLTPCTLSNFYKHGPNNTKFSEKLLRDNFYTISKNHKLFFPPVVPHKTSNFSLNFQVTFTS